MAEIGCYDLNLYCDQPGCTRDPTRPGQFIGRNLAQARREAKRAGWHFNFRQRAVNWGNVRPRVCCPDCAAKRRPQ